MQTLSSYESNLTFKITGMTELIKLRSMLLIKHSYELHVTFLKKHNYSSLHNGCFPHDLILCSDLLLR